MAVGWIAGSIFLFANWLLYRRLQTLISGVLAIIFISTWMIVSAIYIDLANSDGVYVYSADLFRTIGGGYSSLRLALTYCIFVLAVLLVFNRPRLVGLIEASNSPVQKITMVNGIRLNMLAIFVLGIFIITLYIKLFQNPIPLFAGIDRYTYKINYSSMPLKVLYKYLSFIALFTGVLLYYEVKTNRKTKYLVLAMFISIMAYLFLIGNKFSTPFYTLCMFTIPLGLLIKREPYKQDDTSRPKQKRKAAGSLWAFGIGVFLCIIFFAVSIYNYYAKNESWSSKESCYHIIQRVFVRQAQLWWATNDSVCLEGDWEPKKAFSWVFSGEPFPTNTNTSLCYLMSRQVGYERTKQCLEAGYLYTGAYPAIFLELFGPFFLYFVVFICALLFSLLLYLMLRAMVRYHYLSVFFLAFVFQPFVFLIVGGKLVFLVNWKYGLKVVLMLLAMLYDNLQGIDWLNKFRGKFLVDLNYS